MQVVVFGSINMDLVVRIDRLPSAGKTITGQQFFYAPGGKGANQTVASARVSVHIKMVGRVGQGPFGETLRLQLIEARIDSSGVVIDETTSSGVALITVDTNAQNRIIVVPGANGIFTNSDLTRLVAAIEGADVLLLQLEILVPAVLAAIRLAQGRGIKVILDPAPVQTNELPDELYRLVTIITPNETEAAALVGFSLSTESAVVEATTILHKRGAKGVIIKLGQRGIYWSEGLNGKFKSTFAVKAVDTVGAGDAFNGALAAG